MGQGEVGGCHPPGERHMVAVELVCKKAYRSALGGPFLSSFRQTSLQSTPLSLSGRVGSFQSGRESSLMSGCD